MAKLPHEYYLQENVVHVARDLIGKVLVTNIGDELTAGIITETEAYNGVIDKASHAYGGRRTARNEVMYGEGGRAYIYLCYGIHHLFNVVTNIEGIPHAVLVRAIFPHKGTELIYERRGTSAFKKGLTVGPGKVSLALGMHTRLSGESLLEDTIWIEDENIKIQQKEIRTGPRIGVDYAGEDALLPYRFWVEHSLFE